MRQKGVIAALILVAGVIAYLVDSALTGGIMTSCEREFESCMQNCPSAISDSAAGQACQRECETDRKICMHALRPSQ